MKSNGDPGGAVLFGTKVRLGSRRLCVRVLAAMLFLGLADAPVSAADAFRTWLDRPVAGSAGAGGIARHL